MNQQEYQQAALLALRMMRLGLIPLVIGAQALEAV